MKRILCGFVGLASLAAIAALFLLPGVREFFLGPLLLLGVAKIPAIVLTVAQFAGTALTALGIGRGIVKFTDIILGPVRMIGGAVKFVADIALSIFSPFIPNKWLSKAYSFLNNAMGKLNGAKDKVCDVQENEIKLQRHDDEAPLLNEQNSSSLSKGQKVWNFTKNLVFGLVTPIAKAAIFIGNTIFNAAISIASMYVVPILPKKLAKKFNNFIGRTNHKFNQAHDNISNIQTSSPVIADKIYSIKSKMQEAKEKSDKLNEKSQQNISQPEKQIA